ncbi:MAG: NYN domain-containing protein [Acidimicrobiales bacterium]
MAAPAGGVGGRPGLHGRRPGRPDPRRCRAHRGAGPRAGRQGRCRPPAQASRRCRGGAQGGERGGRGRPEGVGRAARRARRAGLPGGSGGGGAPHGGGQAQGGRGRAGRRPSGAEGPAQGRTHGTGAVGPTRIDALAPACAGRAGPGPHRAGGRRARCRGRVGGARRGGRARGPAPGPARTSRRAGRRRGTRRAGGEGRAEGQASQGGQGRQGREGAGPRARQAAARAAGAAGRRLRRHAGGRPPPDRGAGQPPRGDGYNLARAAWSGLGTEEERRRTVALLEDVQARSGGKVVVVFDGDSGTVAPRASKAVRVAFSATGQTADDAIAALLEATPHSQPVVVVSSDREVAADARSQGAAVLSSPAFLRAAGR